MAKNKLEDLDFFQIGILAKFEGEKGVYKGRILKVTLDDKEVVMQALRSLYSKKLISYNVVGEYFDFDNYGFGPKDNSDDAWLKPISDEPEKPKKQKPKPKDPADHALQFMATQHESLSGKAYSPYAAMIQESFNQVNQMIDESRVLALGAFLYAYKSVTGQEFPIPGALEDKKYWSKIAGKHLDNYTLSQLESMYIVAITLHAKDELSIYSPDSISKKLVEAYQLLAAKAKSKAKTKAKIQEAQDKHEPKTYEEQEADLAEKTLNFASGKSGAAKNSPLMWRGYIFDNETDMHAVLAYYSNWQDKIDHETESTMRQKLAEGVLILDNPLPMTELSDLFHFRTAKEDVLLFQAYVFTQRATNPNFNPIALRLEKSTPLVDDLETCDLPEFYREKRDSLAVLDKPVKADSILAQFENLEYLAKIGEVNEN